MRRYFPIVPVPKPRQTQADRWRKRPAVLRYRAFADECRLMIKQPPRCPFHVTFVLPMPRTWSAKKRKAMDGAPHMTKPDVTNLTKAIEDALWPVDDSHLHDMRITKVWGAEGGIWLEEMER
jgi:Holliday junction resolvase RusA-like endonuclease